MANEEHLKVVLQGAEATRAWQAEQRGLGFDLKGAELRCANLNGIDFQFADLGGANLEGAILTGADLRVALLDDANLSNAQMDEARITQASLRGANLFCANLMGADLTGADLSGSNLTQSNLYWTNLVRAILTRAQLSQAMLHETVFGNTELIETQGLAGCVHHGPSFIDWHTIELSGGLPEEFLRGCGWSDWQIEAAKLCRRGLSNGQITDISYAIANKLTSNPFTYYSCFISHSHADKPFARWLHDQLQARGVRCWLDEKQLLPGDDIYRAVDRGIHQYDKFLLCASRASLTSWWVDNEIATVFAKEQRLMKERGEKLNLLLPLDLDAHLFSDDFRNGKQQQLRERLAANFQGWQPDFTGFSAELDRVVKALRADDGARPQPPPSLLK